MDLALIGASWEKERARELGGKSITFNPVIFLLTSMNTPVPKAVYTTFYLGALQENNDSVCIPNPYFAMIFKSTLLLANSSLRDVFHLLVLASRGNLEELNFMIKSSDPVDYQDTGCNNNVVMSSIQSSFWYQL